MKRALIIIFLSAVVLVLSSYQGRKILEGIINDVTKYAIKPFFFGISSDSIKIDSTIAFNGGVRNRFEKMSGRQLDSMSIDEISLKNLPADSLKMFWDQKNFIDSIQLVNKEKAASTEHKNKQIKQGINTNKSIPSTEVENKHSAPVDSVKQNAIDVYNEVKEWTLPDRSKNGTIKPDTTLNNKVNFNMFDYQPMLKYI